MISAWTIISIASFVAIYWTINDRQSMSYKINLEFIKIKYKFVNNKGVAENLIEYAHN